MLVRHLSSKAFTEYNVSEDAKVKILQGPLSLPWIDFNPNMNK